jgi:hypothetical protein
MPSARQLKYVRSVRAYQLAALLTARRQAAGMSQNMVAASLGWSAAKVGHIETAARPARAQDVALLLDLYGVAGSQREEILTLARDARRRNWWTEYVDVLNGPFVALEDEADQICEWAPQVIPGLLQTPDYAWRIISVDPLLSAEEIGKRVDARQYRRKLLDRPDAPHLRVVIDKAVLDRPVGSAAEWQEQLRRLADDARRDNVTVQILPQTVGIHPGIDGSLIVLRFAEEVVPDVAYCEGFFGGVWMESAPKVARCNLAFERLTDVALSPQQSIALIESAALR